MYDICYWEVRRIIRGYRRRGKLNQQLMALCAYSAMYAMRNSEGKKPKDIFPQIFEDDEDDDEGINEEISYTPEEVAEMQAEIESAKDLFKMAGTE